MDRPHWIGVDWGTSNLRTFAIDRAGKVLDERSSDEGMGALRPDQFESILIGLIEPWLIDNHQMPIYACGMVGAKQGWLEAGYRTIPCAPVSDHGLTLIETNDHRIKVQILPGLCQLEPADVMRGEETQIAGFLASKPNFTGSICLPGTHSKWVDIVDGHVMSFQTFLTGELFAIIARHSVLRYSLSDGPMDHQAFKAAAVYAARDPTLLATGLFTIRAESLLYDDAPETASARLSGLLIGHELGAVQNRWETQPVVIIGASEIGALYEDVLVHLGAKVQTMSATDATLLGLKIAANQSEVS